MFSESNAFARGKRYVRIGEIQRAHGGQECPSYILLRCSESNSQINNIKKRKDHSKSWNKHILLKAKMIAWLTSITMRISRLKSTKSQKDSPTARSYICKLGAVCSDITLYLQTTVVMGFYSAILECFWIWILSEYNTTIIVSYGLLPLQKA